MEVVAKAALYLGLVATLGAGAWGRWVAPGEMRSGARRRLAIGAILGVALVASGALGEVVALLQRITRGAADLGLVVEYLGATRHGRWALVTIALAIPLGWWSARRPSTQATGLERVAYAALGVAWLGSVAAAGHSGAMGLGPAAASLAHLIALVGWGGALVWLALLPLWGDPALARRPLNWIDRVGPPALAALLASGGAMTLLHLHDPLSNATSTAYGRAWLGKLALVSVVVVLAGVNRFVHVPAFRRGATAGLRRLVRVEAALLALVLIATAVLSTRPPVHAP